MNPFSPPMVLLIRAPDRTVLAVHPAVRWFQAGAAAAFALGARISGDPLWLAGTAVCLLSALSEDRWILDARLRRIRRSFGIFPLTRHFDLEWDEVEAVFLETLSHPSADELAARSDDLRSLYPRLVGQGARGWTAWGFILNSQRALAVRADSPRKESALRVQAGKVADFLGTELREI